MRFKKGDKVEMGNGTPIVITGEYSAHDGQAYRYRTDYGNDQRPGKLNAWESSQVRERTEDDA